MQHLQDMGNPVCEEDDVVDDNLILLWTETPRIVTGTDLLGRLMRRLELDRWDDTDVFLLLTRG